MLESLVTALILWVCISFGMLIAMGFVWAIGHLVILVTRFLGRLRTAQLD